MPQFTYKAKNGPQEVTSGVIEADTVNDAVAKLIHAGQIPLDVKLCMKAVLPHHITKTKAVRVPKAALFQFTRQLADLLEAGVPLTRGMELLGRQRRFPVMAQIIESMTGSLQKGGSLSMALSRYPDIFSPLYVNTVKAAESSGQLPLVLNRLAQFLETDLQMRSQVKSSLLYPAIIFCVGLLTIFILLSFVLPRLTLMFEDFNSQLPLATRIVVAISQLFAHFWWLMALVVAGCGAAFGSYLKTDEGKTVFDGFILKVPLLKSFIENTQLSRFARTLGMLLESRVPIVSAMESVTLVMDNKALQQEVGAITLKLKSGMSLTQAIKASSLFPEMAVDLIEVGQESGKLEKGLYKLAENCDRTSQEMSGIFVTILGPAVLVLVVGIVGFMIVAMLLPMFQMNAMIQ